jgi:hypothetical protein
VSLLSLPEREANKRVNSDAKQEVKKEQSFAEQHNAVAKDRRGDGVNHSKAPGGPTKTARGAGVGTHLGVHRTTPHSVGEDRSLG